MIILRRIIAEKLKEKGLDEEEDKKGIASHFICTLNVYLHCSQSLNNCYLKI